MAYIILKDCKGKLNLELMAYHFCYKEIQIEDTEVIRELLCMKYNFYAPLHVQTSPKIDFSTPLHV